MSHEIVICVVASDYYIIYLEKLLASARIHLPSANIYAHLVNVDELKDPFLRSLNSNLEIKHEYIEFNNIQYMSGYCANLWPRIIPKLMAKHDCPIVYLDADSLFMNRAHELIEYARKFDVSAEYNSRHPALKATGRKLRKLPKGPFGTPYYGVFNSATITTNNSSIAKDFFKDCNKRIDSHPLDWFADQEVLFLTHEKFEDRIKFNSLESKFCDRINNEDTIIWMAKGSTRNRDEYKLAGEGYIHKVRKWQKKALPYNRDELPKFTSSGMKQPLRNKILGVVKKNLKKFLT